MPLPTREEMFTSAVAELDFAYEGLGDAADRLRSDWAPPGPLTRAQAKARTTMLEEIEVAKAAINRAKGAAQRASAEGVRP